MTPPDSVNLLDEQGKPKLVAMNMKFAYFRGYICTANEDGSIPLNSRVVCFVSDVGQDRTLLDRLLQLANGPEAES